MRIAIIILCFLSSGAMLFAQAPPLNVTLASHFSSVGPTNDCWGWWDGQGNEYAIVGLEAGGVSIVNITNPAAPIVMGTTTGPQSTWRDIKSFQNYVYVVHDITTVPGAGLQIIDMSALPNIVFKDTIIQGILTSHNIYIDEGYAYLCGTTINPGMDILDLNPDPWNPQFVGQYLGNYVHDVYVRDNIAYTSELEFGLAVVDVSDKSNIQIIGQRPYVNSVTHNAWLNDSSTVCFTTDETTAGPVRAFDVSDPQNIYQIDEYHSSLGAPDFQSVPHNVHVLNDFLVTSYYRDGMTIVDASYPYNLIETGHYDTSPLSGDGFEGNWGAYPFFPSGTCIASDRQVGLFIFNVNYLRGCHLEGDITDAVSGNPIANASVTIQNQTWGTTGDTDGFYATGTHIPGTYTVTYSAFGYQDSTETLVLSNGNLVVRDIALQPYSTYAASISVTETNSGLPIPNAVVEISEINGAATFNYVADVNGNINTALFPADYTMISGAWGWQANETPITMGTSSNSFSVQLDPGYQDEFALDLGWTVTSTASDGAWERGDPVGITAPLPPWPFINIQPGDDLLNDIGNKCYVTGLAGGNPEDSDLDDGITELISPPMDLSNYQDPVIRFSRWFFNDGGQTTPNDTLTIEISDGVNTVVYRKIDIMWNNWTSDSIEVNNLLTPTANMTVTFRVGDYSPGHIVESAIDGFKVVDRALIGLSDDPLSQDAAMSVFPNPVQDRATVRYDLGAHSFEGAVFELVDLRGKVLSRVPLGEQKGDLVLDTNLPAGLYFGMLRNSDGNLKVVRIVK